MRLLRLLPLAVLTLVPASVHAQPAAAAPAAAPTTVPVAINSDIIQRMSLRDAPLDLVLGQLEAWTGRIVLRPQALPAAAITLNITHQVTKAEASAALESVLEMNGIGVVYMGDKFIKIVDLAATRPETPELIEGKASELPASNKVMSKIFQLTYLQAANIVPQLNTMLTPRLGGAIFFNNSGSFLVTDTIANLQRVEMLVDKLDNPALPTFKPHFFQLKFAKAADVATSISAIVQGPLQTQIGAANVVLSADARTNQLVVLGDERQIPLFQQLIEKLDVKADPVTVNRVFPIKHGDATKIDPMLHQMINSQATQVAAASNTRGATTPGATRPMITTPPNQPAPTGGPAAPAAAAPANINVTPGASSSSADFSPYMAFTNDPRSNSIVATGTPDDMRILEDLIKGIDVVLPEVRLEVVIVDVSLGDSDTTGISSLGLEVQNNKLIGFNGAFPGLGISGLTGTANTTSTFASLTRTAGLPNSLSGIISLSTTPLKNNATIISAPSIVTSHNTQGMIFVGETDPVITGSVNSGTTGGTTSTVTQLQIGITLTVTPLIGTDGSVYLNIATTVDDSAGSVLIDGNSQPIISSRRTQSYIGCKTGDILVMGGLQSKKVQKNSSRLGPIPFIGDLLGSRTSSDTREDIIFFIRPTVITGDASDNTKALQRVESMPDAAIVNDMLGIAPPPAPAAPAKPGATPAAPDSSSSPALRRQR